MASGFLGRSSELERLAAILGQVGGQGRDLPGVAVMLRGRRRVTDNTTLLAVTRTGEKASEVPIRCLSAEDLLIAWSSPAGCCR